MLKITNIDEATRALAAYIPLSREITGKNITLVRMTPLMDMLGNPQDKLRIIHIAGTSGKTSTTYYATGLLVAAGQKVGTTVSPHVDSITERVQINGVPLAEAEFCSALSEFLDRIVSAKLEPTYFEILIAFAYWYFAKAGVDYAVVETGLGGLYDGTNVATAPNKVCVITDIGYDHMNVLGTTLGSITAQKAGIIHPHNQVITYRQSSVITDVITKWCEGKQATLTLLNQTDLEHASKAVKALHVIPVYQQRNWLLAHAAYAYIAGRDNLAELNLEALERVIEVQVPARMDIRTIVGKKIVMDGAHNGQKMTAFVGSFNRLFPGKKATVLLSLKKGKEFNEVLPLLLPVTDTLILCDFESVQDLHITAINPAELADAARQIGFKTIIIEKNPMAAYGRLLAETTSIGIITGSFYLIGELRHAYPELVHG